MEVLELAAVEDSRFARSKNSRWNRFAELWLRTACWSLVFLGAGHSSAVQEEDCLGFEPSCRITRLQGGERGRSLARAIECARLQGALRARVARFAGPSWRFGALRGKCLQSCIVDSLVGEQRLRCMRYVKANCGNQDLSGYVGTRREARNLDAAREVLSMEGLYVWVYESASTEALRHGGALWGRWRLGNA